MPHEVFAVAGEIFPACRRCGPRASFLLLQAAAHIQADQDFSKSRQSQKPVAKASSQEEE
jgi:hypothetical protein